MVEPEETAIAVTMVVVSVTAATMLVALALEAERVEHILEPLWREAEWS